MNMSHIVKATEQNLFAKLHDDWSKQSVWNDTLPNYANYEVTHALTCLSSDHQCKVKMSGSEKKVNNNMYDILSIKCVTKKFHVVVIQNNRKEMYKKRVLHVQSCFFDN